MGQRRDVIAIVVGMLFVVAVAVWVIVQAAYHPIREGSRVLAPEGERLASGALRLTRKASSSEPRAEPAGEPQPEAQPEPQADLLTGSAAPQGIPRDRPDHPVQQSTVQQPPRQQGSPLATPASGLWRTIAR